MSDSLTPQQRSTCMSRIRSKNTKPEVRLRKALFGLGYRYRLNLKILPGKPDMVLAKYRTCIFVNGCFWHGHKGCAKFVMPKTNVDFWRMKIEKNRERDLRDYTYLESFGWRVIVVWECELGKSQMPETIARVRKELDDNKASWERELADRRKRRAEKRLEDESRRKFLNEVTDSLGIPKSVAKASKKEAFTSTDD